MPKGLSIAAYNCYTFLEHSCRFHTSAWVETAGFRCHFPWKFKPEPLHRTGNKLLKIHLVH